MGYDSVNKYDIDSLPEQILEEFKKEFDTFQKPECNSKDLGAASTEDIIKDIHKAIYGNGGRTKGIIWKLAEYHVRVVDVSNKQGKCREQVVKHMMDFDENAVRRDAGLFGICKKYPKLASIIAILLFFGVSSLWSIIIEQRQATKIEEVVLNAMNIKYSGPQGVQGQQGVQGVQGVQGQQGR